MRRLQKAGNVVVEGIAIGKIQLLNADYETGMNSYQAGGVEEEKERYQNAHVLAKNDLMELLNHREELSESEVEILEAHQMLIDDFSFEDAILGYLEQKLSAPSAVLKAVADFKAMFEEIDDEYLRERQKDIIDVGNRILRKLLNMKEFSIEGEQVVLCAKDIEPSIMAGLSEKQVKAILLGSGSKTSHTVIIAKAKGFVTMVGVDLSPDEVKDGDDVVVDALKGIILIKPDKKELEEYKVLAKQQEEEHRYLMERAQLPARSKDGKEILVAANISNPQDMEKAVAYGCQGVGLYRTEFLFMESSQLPDEERQFEAYKSVAKQADGNLCVIRTLDIGGDKHCEALQLEQEENPFLGFRAIRICLQDRALFKTQIKAVLRAGSHGKIGIMIPMVTMLSEILNTKELIEEAKQELKAENIPFSSEVQVGIMIETPASAIMAPIFAKHVDFFSIGTNDLVQYTLAVDRGNQKVSYLYDYFNPAVLHSIYRIVTSAHEAGIWAGMCGEMAGDRLALPFLLALGVDELSMSASQAPMIKEQIRNMDCDSCDLEKILQLKDTQEVRTYLKNLL
ncbi:MAG: phosphoenolpyruvate--protein phosphotransferase [Lachnospiraceae bacterium]|nr:phosphoenolpyruvate--protein phosphotransferase [Lachnospiraceae bacterium]